jgi:succinyl-diaminopimelate desuccinylase
MRFGEVDNFWARRGNAAPLLCFAGHTDVVPSGPAEAWRCAPFEPTARDGCLWGRGTADMKASLAAMVVACEEFVASQPEHAGSIAFLVTSDEEGPAEGWYPGGDRAPSKRAGKKSTGAWWASPRVASAWATCCASAGAARCRATCSCSGVQGHVAYPEAAVNPLHKLAPVMAELVALAVGCGQRRVSSHQLPAHQSAFRHRLSQCHPGLSGTEVQHPLLHRADL